MASTADAGTLGGLEWTAIPAEPALLTACRRGEVLGATWEEIDLEARIWTIPAVRMKGGKVHRVPLSNQTMQILRIVAVLRRGKHVFSWYGNWPANRRNGNLGDDAKFARVGDGTWVAQWFP